MSCWFHPTCATLTKKNQYTPNHVIILSSYVKVSKENFSGEKKTCLSKYIFYVSYMTFSMVQFSNFYEEYFFLILFIV